jgi:hypothetical protein
MLSNEFNNEEYYNTKLLLDFLLIMVQITEDNSLHRKK